MLLTGIYLRGELPADRFLCRISVTLKLGGLLTNDANIYLNSPIYNTYLLTLINNSYPSIPISI